MLPNCLTKHWMWCTTRTDQFASVLSNQYVAFSDRTPNQTTLPTHTIRKKKCKRAFWKGHKNMSTAVASYPDLRAKVGSSVDSALFGRQEHWQKWHAFPEHVPFHETGCALSRVISATVSSWGQLANTDVAAPTASKLTACWTHGNT